MVGLIGAVLAFNYSVVFLSGEMRPYRDVVMELQEDTTAVYGCVFNNDYYPLKAELYDVRKPQILVAGSSRVMYYSQLFFKEKIANCSLAIRDFHTGVRFLRMVQRDCYPHTILLGLDNWWFNVDKDDEPDVENLARGDELTFDKLFGALPYYLEGKFSFAEVVGNYFARPDEGEAKRIGLRAIEQGRGFLYDGTNRWDVPQRKEILDFEKSGKRLIKKQGRPYKIGSKFRRETVDLFFAEVERLKERGVNVIVFFSPLFPKYYEYMEKTGKYEYVFKLIEYTKERYGVFSYVDPATLALGSSDFYDLIHLQKSGAAKLLLDLLEREPRLRDMVDMDHLEKVARKGQ